MRVESYWHIERARQGVTTSRRAAQGYLQYITMFYNSRDALISGLKSEINMRLTWLTKKRLNGS